MRELVLKMSMSVDGFVAGGRAGSDWVLRAGTADSAAWVLETLSGAGIHALGRRTFETFAEYWPTSKSPMARPMNDIAKVVFTRQPGFAPAVSVAESSSPAAVSWASARVADGDLAAEVGRLKQEAGDYILAQGGVELCRNLVRCGLVDEYRFVVLPVALGTGEGLFTDLPDELDLTLLSSTRFRGGVLGNVYRPTR
jgi:dihydrofolate reductase